jgi:DNA-binding MarR family transcriptional regulator
MQRRSAEGFAVIRGNEERQEKGAATFVISDSLGYLVNYAARAFARELAARLSVHGVRVAQWAVLMFLWAEDGVSQRELSRRVAIEDATMVRTIDRMERDGLVRRERNARDRRQIKVFLTEKGSSVRDVLVPEAIAVNEKAARLFTKEETRQFRYLLRRVVDALTDSPSSTGYGGKP